MVFRCVKVKPAVYEAIQFHKLGDHGRVFQGYVDSSSGRDVAFITDKIPRTPKCRAAFILCSGNNGIYRNEIKPGQWIVNKEKDNQVFRIYDHKEFLKKFVGAKEESSIEVKDERTLSTIPVEDSFSKLVPPFVPYEPKSKE